MKRSSIGWADYSSGDCNFVTGCSAISPGCKHCYARAIYERFGLNFDEVTVHEDKLRRLAKTRFPQDGNKRGAHTKPLVFVCDTGDLFHPDVPSDFVRWAFTVMAARQDVIWVVLTKRPRIMAETLTPDIIHRLGWNNIWLGVTAETQAMADQRIPILLNTWLGTAFVSVEPMLEPVNLELYLEQSVARPRLDWVICGGESGPNRRPFSALWAKSLYLQCQDNGVPFFYKQGSAFRPGQDDLVDGREFKEWPR